MRCIVFIFLLEIEKRKTNNYYKKDNDFHQKFKDYKINTKVPIETSLNKSITSLFFILMQP